MSGTSWLESLKSAKKTCLEQDGQKKIHYLFPDGTELSESYDASSFLLTERKWKRKGCLGGEGNWDFEVGENLMKCTIGDGFVESNSNPILVRKDTRDSYQWRIRNLPYPLNIYSLTIDSDNQQFVLRTSNKKYFKRFDIPDLKRLSISLDEKSLSFSHANNTLIITYNKPESALKFEKEVQTEVRKVKPITDSEVDQCKQS